MQRDDFRQLELLLCDLQALSATLHVVLAQLGALLVLNGAEHAEGAIRACSTVA